MLFKLTCFVLLFSLYKSTSTAPPPSLSPLTIFNITVPHQITPVTQSLSIRPQEPLEMRSDWDGPGFITLIFYNYGADIPSQLALFCTSLAIEDVESGHHQSMWNQPIGKSELLYTNLHPPIDVILGVLPRAAMTWSMFYYAMLMVHRFTRDFQSMAFEFRVKVTGLQELVATGNLSSLLELGP